MSQNLREDMCDPRATGVLVGEVSEDKVQKVITADLQYACSYWFEHF